MVMEVPPSPQIVGCEFVRQYYTLLNQAPAHLHRFYSENSLFIHGGLDVPNRETKQVVGQVQIHEHIQQLNFRDCHAKISQVDSQATLGNGVVVQVSGELSNGGQPMRRFTQTFVLAAQSPKKYYVHNDIFRYQDLLVDEEADLSRSEDEGECESSTESVQNGQGGDYYPTSGVADALNGGSQLIEETSPAFPPPPAVTQPVPEITQAPLPTPSPAPVVPAASQQFTTVKQVEESVVDAAPPSPPVKEEEEWGGSDQWGDSTPIETPLAPSPPPPVSNEPKTYANLLKSGPGSQSYSNVSSGYQKPSSPPPASLQKSSDPINSSSRDSLPPPRTSLPPSQPSRGPRPGPVPSRGGIRDRPPQTRASFSEDNDSEKSMGYRSGPPRHSGNFIPSNGLHFNDNQQLFMGNIPLHAQEDELRALFGQFGTILDLKIFSKAGLKGPTNRVPNYGFLIYEDPNTVETVLQNRPIYFPSRDDPSAVKLNVEEKKRRTPGPPDSRPPMDNRPRGGGAPMRGSRGGSRGGGMYRGGESRGNMPPNTNSQGLRNSTSNSYKPR